MSVITLTTVGFGDYSPSTRVGRVVGVFWMLSGISSTARFLGAMQAFLFHLAEERRFSEADVVSKGIFEKVDTNQDGTLSKEEFVQYIILKQHLLDPVIMNDIFELFDKIDADRSGSISLDELRSYQTQRTGLTEEKKRR